MNYKYLDTGLISDNFRKVNEFVNKSKKIMFKWLNRRSQKKSFSWKKFEMFQSKYPLPKVKIYHTLYTTSKRLYLEPYA